MNRLEFNEVPTGYVSQKREGNDDHISDESDSLNNHIKGEYGVLKSFANKMLADVTPIDEEIQEVINNHFWAMI